MQCDRIIIIIRDENNLRGGGESGERERERAGGRFQRLGYSVEPVTALARYSHSRRLMAPRLVLGINYHLLPFLLLLNRNRRREVIRAVLGYKPKLFSYTRLPREGFCFLLWCGRIVEMGSLDEVL